MWPTAELNYQQAEVTGRTTCFLNIKIISFTVNRHLIINIITMIKKSLIQESEFTSIKETNESSVFCNLLWILSLQSHRPSVPPSTSSHEGKISFRWPVGVAGVCGSYWLQSEPTNSYCWLKSVALTAVWFLADHCSRWLVCKHSLIHHAGVVKLVKVQCKQEIENGWLQLSNLQTHAGTTG